MNKGNSEKRTDIWLKYCEECVRSKIEANGEILNNPVIKTSKKTIS
ncbi:MAG: hypothetical protein ACFFKA_14350 [Candidatus Thorarchaeota archaeon]